MDTYTFKPRLINGNIPSIYYNGIYVRNYIGDFNFLYKLFIKERKSKRYHENNNINHVRKIINETKLLGTNDIYLKINNVIGINFPSKVFLTVTASQDGVYFNLKYSTHCLICSYKKDLPMIKLYYDCTKITPDYIYDFLKELKFNCKYCKLRKRCIKSLKYSLFIFGIGGIISIWINIMNLILYDKI